MLFKDINRILTISAHADDMELGCGATVNKLIGNGAEVFSLVISLNQKGVPEKFMREDIIGETHKGGEVLGLTKDNIFIENFENRVFPWQRQEILDKMIEYREKINPDLVFTGSLDDLHQDHKVAAEESLRAFKGINILSYGFDWNRLNKYVNFYSIISEEHLNKKIEAVQCYKSQMDHRSYFSPEYIRAWAITRGIEIKTQYAETFEVIRFINK